MAETQNAGAQPPKAGERVIVREYEMRPEAPPAPTKLFRLKAGYSHHVGDAVVGLKRLNSGGGPDAPTVRLTEAQARAFADKFEAVDNSDFEVYHESADDQRKNAARSQNADLAKDTEGGPQGKPPVAPPEPVHGATGKAGSALPADITTLDPARQGQPTEEQARVIRSGGAPAPTFKVDPKDTPDVPQKVGSPATPIAGTGTGAPLGDNKNSTVESTKVPDSVSGQSGGSAKATETKK